MGRQAWRKDAATCKRLIGEVRATIGLDGDPDDDPRRLIARQQWAASYSPHYNTTLWPSMVITACLQVEKDPRHTKDARRIPLLCARLVRVAARRAKKRGEASS